MHEVGCDAFQSFLGYASFTLNVFVRKFLTLEKNIDFQSRVFFFSVKNLEKMKKSRFEIFFCEILYFVVSLRQKEQFHSSVHGLLAGELPLQPYTKQFDNCVR